MKRLLSIALALVLVFSLVPSAFAADFNLNVLRDTISEAEDNSKINMAQSISSGQTVLGTIRLPPQYGAADYDYMDMDYYTFTLEQESHVLFILEGESGDNNFYLGTSDANGDAIQGITPTAAFYDESRDTYTAMLTSLAEDTPYGPGTYYVCVFSTEDERYSGEEYFLYYEALPVEQEQAEVLTPVTDPHQAAQALYELGLFSGTGTDAGGNPVFDLDRAPTRHEAVTMLVRLLGKGEEARNGAWETPFTDVSDWAAPYVGYAYANRLTAGTSATTFGGDDTVTASQYLSFVLRALGYSSGTDFQWDKAWELSDELGITSGQYNAGSSFTRGDVAVVSYNALSAKLKGQDTTLLSALGKEDLQESGGQNTTDDYTYLAARDFRRIKRQYSTATAQHAYVTVYTNLDGDLCVLTDVYYKIIDNHHELTLHNITTGDTIIEPNDYYQTMIDRSYGAGKLHLIDLMQELLEHHVSMLEGREGSLISAGELNS